MYQDFLQIMLFHCSHFLFTCCLNCASYPLLWSRHLHCWLQRLVHEAFSECTTIMSYLLMPYSVVHLRNFNLVLSKKPTKRILVKIIHVWGLLHWLSANFRPFQATFWQTSETELCYLHHSLSNVLLLAPDTCNFEMLSEHWWFFWIGKMCSAHLMILEYSYSQPSLAMDNIFIVFKSVCV